MSLQVLVNGFDITNGFTHRINWVETSGLFDPAALVDPEAVDTFEGPYRVRQTTTDYGMREVSISGILVVAASDYASKLRALDGLQTIYAARPSRVVVGTLDALYAPGSSDATVDLRATLTDALRTVPDNLRAIGDQLTDPLGLDLGDLSDSAAAAEAQAIAQGTLGAMRTLFPNGRAAFAYLLFVLLYMPCVATLGVIFKEQGAFWAVFSAGWSFTIAYSSAVVVYQLPTVLSQPVVALGWTGAAVALAAAILTALVRYGRQREARLIPVLRVD